MGDLENMNEYYIILSHYKGSCLLVNTTYILSASFKTRSFLVTSLLFPAESDKNTKPLE